MTNSDNWYEEMRALVESNSRAMQAMAEDTARLKLSFEARNERELRGQEELRQAMEKLRQAIQSNSRAIQATTNDTAH